MHEHSHWHGVALFIGAADGLWRIATGLLLVGVATNAPPMAAQGSAQAAYAAMGWGSFLGGALLLVLVFGMARGSRLCAAGAFGLYVLAIVGLLAVDTNAWGVWELLVRIFWLPFFWFGIREAKGAAARGAPVDLGSLGGPRARPRPLPEPAWPAGQAVDPAPRAGEVGARVEVAEAGVRPRGVLITRRGASEPSPQASGGPSTGEGVDVMACPNCGATYPETETRCAECNVLLYDAR